MNASESLLAGASSCGPRWPAPALAASARRCGAAEKKHSLKKAVKYGMIKVPGASIEDKFKLDQVARLRGRRVRQPQQHRSRGGRAGPRQDRHQDSRRDRFGALAASASRIPIRPCGPKASKRCARRSTTRKFYGADTVLLVPGKVSNPETENYEQCYARSQEEIRKVIPQADRRGREDRDRGGVERLHHQARAVDPVRRRLSTRPRSGPISIAATCSSTACRRPPGFASSASGC